MRKLVTLSISSLLYGIYTKILDEIIDEKEYKKYKFLKTPLLALCFLLIGYSEHKFLSILFEVVIGVFISILVATACIFQKKNLHLESYIKIFSKTARDMFGQDDFYWYSQIALIVLLSIKKKVKVDISSIIMFTFLSLKQCGSHDKINNIFIKKNLRSQEYLYGIFSFSLYNVGYFCVRNISHKFIKSLSEQK